MNNELSVGRSSHGKEALTLPRGPPAAHRGPRWSRYPPAARGGAHAGAGGCARRRLWPCGKAMLEQAPGRACDPVERGAHGGAGLLAGAVTRPAGAVCEELQPVGRPHVGGVRGGLSPVGGSPRWSRGRA